MRTCPVISGLYPRTLTGQPHMVSRRSGPSCRRSGATRQGQQPSTEYGQRRNSGLLAASRLPRVPKTTAPIDPFFFPRFDPFGAPSDTYREIRPSDLHGLLALASRHGACLHIRTLGFSHGPLPVPHRLSISITAKELADARQFETRRVEERRRPSQDDGFGYRIGFVTDIIEETRTVA